MCSHDNESDCIASIIVDSVSVSAKLKLLVIYSLLFSCCAALMQSIHIQLVALHQESTVPATCMGRIWSGHVDAFNQWQQFAFTCSLLHYGLYTLQYFYLI